MRWWWRWERLLRTFWWRTWQWIWEIMQKILLRFIKESWSLHLNGKQLSPQDTFTFFSPNRFWWIFAFVGLKFQWLFASPCKHRFFKVNSIINQRLNQEPPVAEPGAKRTGRENPQRLHSLGWWSWWWVWHVGIVVVFSVVVVVSKQRTGLWEVRGKNCLRCFSVYSYTLCFVFQLLWYSPFKKKFQDTPCGFSGSSHRRSHEATWRFDVVVFGNDWEQKTWSPDLVFAIQIISFCQWED